MDAKHPRPGTIVAAAIVVMLAFAVCLPADAIKDESPQLTQLLTDANNEAIDVASDADLAKSLILSDENWVNHALLLAKIKGHADNLVLIMEKLRKIGTSGSALQEQAVMRILPLAKELSANTSAAIAYLSENKTRPLSETYTQYLEMNAETAHQLSSAITSLVDYETSMTDIETLRSELEAQ
jgi:hypothetical protein